MPTQDPLALPASLHIETAVLGTMLLDGIAIQDAITHLRAEDFSLDSNQRVFRVILSLMERQVGVDSLTVAEELTSRGELSSIGGPGYLAFLSEGIPRNFNIAAYVRIVKEKSMLRRAMVIHHDGYQMAADPSQDSETFIAESIRQFEELRSDAASKPMQTAGQYLQSLGHEDAVLESMATTGGLSLGWAQWDDITGGLQKQELAVVAAVSGMGKTAWGCNVVHNVAVVQGKVVAYFPLEDKRRAAIRRMLSAASGLDYRKIRDGILSNYDRATFRDHHRLLSAAPLYMEDANGLTMTRIKSRCAQLKRQVGALDLAVIDQLSHVPDDDVATKGSSLEERTGRQALAAKHLAEDVDVPVILLHQMTQESAKRTNPRPVLTDLRGSGKIKDHADIVAFLFREEYFNKSDELLRGKGEIIIAKARQSEVKDCKMEWDGRIQKWTDPQLPKGMQGSLDERYGGQF